MLIRPLGTNFSEILVGIQTFFIQENVLENVVCEMASILSRPQCVNWYDTSEISTLAGNYIPQPSVGFNTHPDLNLKENAVYSYCMKV